FTAGRYENSPQPNTFVQTGGSYTRVDTNKRGELKLTHTFGGAQTISGDFTSNSTVQHDRPSLNAASSLDPSVLVTETIPNKLFVTTYNGVLSNKYFATLQYSQKTFEFVNAGGTKTEIAASSWPACHRRCTMRRRSSVRSIPNNGTTSSSPAACRTRCPRDAPARTT